MTTILDDLAASARERVAALKLRRSMADMKAMAEDSPAPVNLPFERALSRDGMSFICECKKASPSKGVIDDDYRYLDIAEEYETAGADAISVLTEPTRFLGSSEHLREISHAVSVPCLRKDFTVDPYMIYEARWLGASAVLLICSILSDGELSDHLALCAELGLSALVEAHDDREIATAVSCGARVIGVNNRDLKDFSVDVGHSARLRSMVPRGVLFVAESGIRDAADVQRMSECGADAVLVGETLMRAQHKGAALAALRG